ncbi:Protein kinase domain [Macleaya cordata]|uniref:Protein kinase domain n=1 Tax=Macleaya cordata TaxID=56857 RepID=A0A200Q7M9_MACCD|nr:Protein kinase domain [Macleaya cordata]
MDGATVIPTTTTTPPPPPLPLQNQKVRWVFSLLQFKTNIVLVLSILILGLEVNSTHYPGRQCLGLAMKFCCFYALRGSKSKSVNSHRQTEEIQTNVRLFSYNMLRSATRNFHPSNKLGAGGFGVVYKGVLRDDTFVAVKSLSAESAQGTREFLTEIDTISNVRHPNLVQLIGCCIEGTNRMLVYEYLEHNSIASALFGPKSKRISLDWSQRAAISMGTAQGLAFLHEETEPHIVHRDIKASNILLDAHLNPKIGDFGLAKLFPDNVTHISTRVAGTMGYLAPEYALLGQLTKKVDIYSFGVLLLEIVSGRSCSTSAWGEELMLLVDWTWKLREEDRLLDIVDPELGEYPEDEVLRFIKVAIFCTQAASNQRPSMTQVVKMLSKEMTVHEMELTPPGFHKSNINQQHSASGSSQESSSQQVQHKDKISINPFISSTQLNTPSISMIELQPR